MKIEIYIPDSLDEITLGQYQKFLSISKDKEQDLFIQQKMIEIFCKLNLKDIANIKYTSLRDIIEHFNELFSRDYKLIQSFKMDGLEYGFIPKLDDITFGEYVTLDTYLGDWENIHKAMEVLYRPITNKHKKSYNIEKYKGGKYDMSKMPLSAALGSIVFFYSLGTELLKTTLNYSAKQASRTIAEQQVLGENGDGINQSTQSLKETLRILNLLRRQTFINA